MKKILSIAMLLALSVSLYAQKNVTKFLGIPVDGSKAAMIQKLKAKGFQYDATSGFLEGEFNGQKVYLSVVTNKDKVYRIAVVDKNSCDETQIKIRFNILCNQFENNPRYMKWAAEIIPEDENIYYQMGIKNKEYQAAYLQLPEDEDLYKRVVWFKIMRENRKYGIIMYYDNGFNQADGDDL